MWTNVEATPARLVRVSAKTQSTCSSVNVSLVTEGDVVNLVSLSDVRFFF